MNTTTSNVGIGTTSPTSKLDVNGKVRWLENITVWVPITLRNSTDLTVTDFNGYTIRSFPDGSTQTAGAAWYVPENVVKVVSVTPVFLFDGTGNVEYNVTVTAAADGETYNTHQNTGGTKLIAGAFNKRNDGAEENSTQIAAIGSLTQGDIVGLKIVRYGGNDADTINNWVHPVGFKVKVETNGVV